MTLVMNATKLIELMNQRPFSPLEIRLNDGGKIKVEEPFNLAVARNQPTFIVYEDEGATRYIAYRNVTEVVTRNSATT